jgi:Protein of unknown function (DUF3551)
MPIELEMPTEGGLTREARMKAIQAAGAVLILSSLTVLDARPAASEIYRPWCAQYYSSSGNGATNCGFVSYEQCMMTATPGSGAFCVRNPWYQAYGSGQNDNASPRRARRN